MAFKWYIAHRLSVFICPFRKYLPSALGGKGLKEERLQVSLVNFLPFKSSSHSFRVVLPELHLSSFENFRYPTKKR